MAQLIKFLFSPALFGFAFIAPLIAQLLAVSPLNTPFGINNLIIGLIIGGTWGLIAQWRGSWVWVQP